jgi:ribosomal protein S18 acetylase RimI-like enzyme
MSARHAVRPLDLGDDETANAVLALQRAAYAVEADLIGSDGIPALTETLQQLRNAGESWLGALDPETGRLSGAVAWRELDPGSVDICRLVVAPEAFRQGIATALLNSLDGAFPGRPMIVSTGRGNEPAVALYRRRGFRVVRDREAAPGPWVTELERPGRP